MNTHAADRLPYYPSKTTFYNSRQLSPGATGPPFWRNSWLGHDTRTDRKLPDRSNPPSGRLPRPGGVGRGLAGGDGQGLPQIENQSLGERSHERHAREPKISGWVLHAPSFVQRRAMRLRGVSHNPTAPLDEGWRGFNYAKPKVRDHMMTILRDVIENYDFEGLELDWGRWPLCCRPDAPDNTATSSHSGTPKFGD